MKECGAKTQPQSKKRKTAISSGQKLPLRVTTATATHNSTTNRAHLFITVPKAIQELTGISPDSFKCQLDKCLATEPDEPPTPGYPSSSNSSLAASYATLEKELAGHSRGPP